MEKVAFLTRVAETMKGIVSREEMMEAIQRSCMRSETENIELMRLKEGEADRIIDGLTAPRMLDLSDDLMDVLVLRYLRNTQFLSRIKEDDIDVSGLEGDFQYWKKTMLFRAP